MYYAVAILFDFTENWTFQQNKQASKQTPPPPAHKTFLEAEQKIMAEYLHLWFSYLPSIA